MENVIMCLPIVVGVFQIILFFKLWIMTNDIRKIKDKGVSVKEAKIAYLSGDLAKAKKIMDESFFGELIELKKTGRTDYYNQYSTYSAEYAQLYIKMGLTAPDFDKYVNPDSVL